MEDEVKDGGAAFPHDEVDAIRRRHEAALARMADNNWPMSEGRQDVATLLALLSRADLEPKQ